MAPPPCQPTLWGDQGVVVGSATAATTLTAAGLTAAANLKTAAAERPRFDIVCPKNGCNITNDTLDKLSGGPGTHTYSLYAARRGGVKDERRLAVLLDDHALPNVGYPTTIRT